MPDWSRGGPLLLRHSRWRTWLRGRTPDRLFNRGYFVPKARDCGDHEWYKRDPSAQACYHCIATDPHRNGPDGFA